MALNDNNACLLLALIVMVSSNVVVNGQALKDNAAKSPSAAVNGDKAWTDAVTKALSEPMEIQNLSIKTFIDVELPMYLDEVDPETKESIINGCKKNTKEILDLLNNAMKMVQENEPWPHLVKTLNEAESDGRGCLYELAQYDVDVPTISGLVMEFESALRKAVKVSKTKPKA